MVIDEDSCCGSCCGRSTDPIIMRTPPRGLPCHCEPSSPALAPLPIAPTSTPPQTATRTKHTHPTPCEIKRRLRAHLRDSGVMDTILAQLRASLRLPQGKQGQQPLHAGGEDEARWRQKAKILEARMKELEEAARQQRQQEESRPDAAEVAERVKRECEARLRQEMEKGK